MILLGSLLKHIVDPGTFIIILILGFIKFDKKMMAVYAIIVALLAEYIGVIATGSSRGFGDGLILLIIGTSIQSIIAYFIIKFFKNRKKST